MLCRSNSFFFFFLQLSVAIEYINVTHTCTPRAISIKCFKSVKCEKELKKYVSSLDNNNMSITIEKYIRIIIIILYFKKIYYY